jgi:hypothetical protein
VDRESDPELSVLTQLRISSSSRRAVAFAIVPEHSSVPEASRVSDFILGKPLNSVNMSRRLRAAYGIMLKERQRYFRHPLRLSVHLTDSTYRRFLGETINISQTGIALECATPFAVGELVHLEFYLPALADKMNCKAQIMWRGERGKTGLKFTSMNAADRERLASWIEKDFHRIFRTPPSTQSSIFCGEINPLIPEARIK